MTKTLEQIANELQCEVKDVQRLMHQEEYRRDYNKRPDVIAKRKAYNSKRNEEMKVLREALKSNPELKAQLLGE